jgi:hypothetical protein
VWERVIEMGGLVYWMVLVAPFSFVFPFLGLPFLLPGLGDLVANSLSANPMPRGRWAYHSAALIPALTVAAIFGIERITRWQKKFSAQELSGFALAASLVTGYALLPLPLIGTINIWAPNNVLNWPDPAVQVIRSAVGNNTSLSVQANVGAHFTQRQSIYMYPNKAGEVDAIILHLASPTTNINFSPEHLGNSSRKEHQNWLDGYLQMDRTEYLASIEGLLENNEYGILFWDDPWLVLSKKVDDYQPEDIQKVNQLLKKLHGEWRIDAAEYQEAMKKHKLIISHTPPVFEKDNK